jgi:CRISPR-associated protein Cas1
MTSEHNPYIRVMALHALAYCERLFYLEEVEEIRVVNGAMYAGRALHEELKKIEEEHGQWTSIEVASDRLGLVGKVDCLRKLDGQIIPYEHKRGRSKKEGKTPKAWPADRVQVVAYAMLLEEAFNQEVLEARIRYHAEKVTVRIQVNQEAKQEVLRAISRAIELRNSTERPPVAENENLCIRCSLSPVCMPEEERMTLDENWEPIRLFPPDREVKTIHVMQAGSRVGRCGNSFRVQRTDGATFEYPVNEVGSLVVHGYSQISTQSLYLCAQNRIPVHFITTGGRYLGAFNPGTASVHRRLRQLRALSDQAFCLNLSIRLVTSKVQNALRYILRSTRGAGSRPAIVEGSVRTIRECLKSVARARDTEQLRGYEGLAARAYFDAVPAMLRQEIPSELNFCQRNRRPPRDRFNALLGFGYALLYQAVMQSILTVGLEPAIGFFHTPRSSAHPLALDIMELFRVPMWDMPLIGSVNRLQWDVLEDFTVSPGRIWLSDSGRRKAVHLFERRLEEVWKHPILGYSLSYARLMELEVRLLEKEWSGGAGLFARMRLR